MQPKVQSVHIADVRRLIGERASHRYLEETYRGIASLEQNAAVNFFNHTVSLFVRIPASMLKSIKSCELQLGLINTAEFNALEYQLQTMATHKNLTSLLSTQETWNPSNFSTTSHKLQENFNLILLRKEYTEKDVERFRSVNPSANQFDINEAINWNLFVNYVGNMITVAEKIECSESAIFSKAVGASTSKIGTIGTQLSISAGYGYNSKLPNFCTDNVTAPFQVYLTNHVAQERVTVTAVDNTTPGNCQITFERNSAPQNFSKVVKDPSEDESVWETIPSTWTCEASAYFDDVCDCNCGAFDVYGCHASPVSPSCDTSQVCSLGGSCISKEVGLSFENPSTIAVSDSCKKIVLPGERLIVGYVGDEATLLDSCRICPGDTLYDGEGYLDPKSGSMVCLFTTEGTMAATAQNVTKFAPDPDTLNYNNLVTKDGIQYPYAPIVVKSAIKFPEKPLVSDLENDQKPYTVNIAGGTSRAAQLDVIGAEPYDPAAKLQTLYIRSTKESAFLIFSRYLAQGQIVTTISPFSSSILVQPMRDDSSETTYIFTSEDVPYSVRFFDQSYPITRVQNVTRPGGRKFQLLTLAGKPSLDATVGDVTLHVHGSTCGCEGVVRKGVASFVASFVPGKSFWRQDLTLSDLQAATELVIVDPVQEKSEILSLDTITPETAWDLNNPDCALEMYGAEDGYCNCGCAGVDPDCFIVGLSPLDASDYLFQSCATAGEICDIKPGSGSLGTCIDPTTVSADTWWTAQTTNEDIPGAFAFRINTTSSLNFDYTVGSFVGTRVNEDISRVSSVELIRSSSSYLARDRSLENSVEEFDSIGALSMESAIFITPTRKPFETLDLCPTKSIVNDKYVSKEYTNWKFKQDRMTDVRCSKYEPFPFGSPHVDSCLNMADLSGADSILGNCTNEMPVTRRLNISATIPVSDRFSSMLSRGGAVNTLSVDDPETTFDFEFVYHFEYDPDVEDVERAFAAEKQLGGDSTPNGQQYRFFGALDYRGRGDGLYMPDVHSTNYVESTPASVPLVSLKLSLGFDEVRTQSIADERKPQYWPRGNVQDFFSREFEKTSLPWDWSSVVGDIPILNEDQYLPLSPGYFYTVQMQIQVTPSYFWEVYALTGNLFFFLNPFIDAFRLGKYSIVVGSTSVSRERILGGDNNEARVRFLIQFDAKTQQIFTKRTQTLSSVLSDVGSAVALVGVGLSLLGFLQKIRKPPVVDLQKAEKKKLEKQRRDSYKTQKKQQSQVSHREGDEEPEKEAANFQLQNVELAIFDDDNTPIDEKLDNSSEESDHTTTVNVPEFSVNKDDGRTMRSMCQAADEDWE
mmetsp:Transcript_9162/g.33826  ORF Transcript_9162/g.33826 Transcript_9162/m.33826 type:complete len:1316 (-) Transcript_9162:34-3981(-)